MNKPHVHQALIIAWANGALIEYYDDLNEVWMPSAMPEWRCDTQYRVKVPLPVVKFIFVNYNHHNEQRQVSVSYATNKPASCDNLKLTFDPLSNKLIAAEVL